MGLSEGWRTSDEASALKRRGKVTDRVRFSTAKNSLAKGRSFEKRSCSATGHPRSASPLHPFALFHVLARRNKPFFSFTALPSLLTVGWIPLLFLLSSLSLSDPTSPIALQAEEPIPPTPIPPSLSYAEPNDGELLGSVLTLQFQVGDPVGERVGVFFGGTLLGFATVEGGSASVRVDTSLLPNGPVTLTAALFDGSAELLASIDAAFDVDHPHATVIDTRFHQSSLVEATLLVHGLEDSVGQPLPYLVLVARDREFGEFPPLEVDLDLPAAQTRIAASGTLYTSAAGTAELNFPLSEDAVSASAAVYLQVLVRKDGQWHASPIQVIDEPLSRTTP